MKVLTKPKQYNLPEKSNKRNTPTRLYQSPSQSLSHSLVKSKPKSKSPVNNKKNALEVDKLPNIFMQRRIKSSMSKYNDITVSYIKNNKPNNPQNLHFRKQIRKALTNKINFLTAPTAMLENGCYKFISDQLLNKLKQPIKPLQYDSEQYRSVYENIKDIFGDDIELEYKDIIAAYGIVTQCYYVFFTSTYCVPFSMCCQAVIYVSVEERERNVVNRYARKVMAKYLDRVGKKNQDFVVLDRFICSKCLQSVLTVEFKSPEYEQMSRVLVAKKKDQDFQLQRQKISMSIIVASGRFKKMRIDQALSRKDSIEVVHPIDLLSGKPSNKSITSIKKITSRYLL